MRGEREIDPDEAAIVVRIFRDYAAGVSPQTIAKQLNAEHLPGPSGRTWRPSTLHGHVTRGTGILNNELYIGRLIWNRLRYLNDPDTGRRVSRLNPPSQWVITEVPALRIVDDDLWRAAKARQQQIRDTVAAGGNTVRAHRPLYLFSGLIRCGVCGVPTPSTRDIGWRAAGGANVASARTTSRFGARNWSRAC